MRVNTMVWGKVVPVMVGNERHRNSGGSCSVQAGERGFTCVHQKERWCAMPHQTRTHLIPSLHCLVGYTYTGKYRQVVFQVSMGFGKKHELLLLTLEF